MLSIVTRPDAELRNFERGFNRPAADVACKSVKNVIDLFDFPLAKSPPTRCGNLPGTF